MKLFPPSTVSQLTSRKGGSLMNNRIAIPVIMLFLLVLTSVGCKSSADLPDAEISTHSGLIYLIEDNRILVVEGIDSVNIPWNSWFEAGKRAIVFSITADTVIELDNETVTADQLRRGQSVEVLYSGALAESYPEQGSADKVMIINPTASAEKMTDSGRFSGLETAEGEMLIAIHISGTPEEMPPRVYRLTPEAGELLDHLKPSAGDELLFHYIGDQESAGLIYDLSLLKN
jgi:hypothetical protein